MSKDLSETILEDAVIARDEAIMFSESVRTEYNYSLMTNSELEREVFRSDNALAKEILRRFYVDQP